MKLQIKPNPVITYTLANFICLVGGACILYWVGTSALQEFDAAMHSIGAVIGVIMVCLPFLSYKAMKKRVFLFCHDDGYSVGTIQEDGSIKHNPAFIAIEAYKLQATEIIESDTFIAIMKKLKTLKICTSDSDVPELHLRGLKKIDAENLQNYLSGQMTKSLEQELARQNGGM